MPTDIPWLDKIVEEAGVPAALDLEGAALAHSEVTGIVVSPTTYRRKPVRYTLFGRSRRYTVRDVIDYARQCVEEAPVRKPAPRRYKRTPGTTLNNQTQ